MDQPERLPVIAFIIACIGVFFVLYLILGGEDTAIGVKVETSDEILLDDELLDEDDPPVYRQRRPISSTPPVNNGFSLSVETPRIDTVETTKRQIKEWPDWIKRHRRKNKTQSIEQKKAKLRAQLKARGFTNQKYLDQRALGLEREGFKSARNKVERLIESGDIDEALKVLQEELDRTPEENLIVRSEIVALQTRIAMRHGYASNALEYFHQQMRLTRNINEIKKNSQLINNPNARAMMEEADKTLDAYDKYKESLPLLFQNLKENNGLPPGMKDLMKSIMVGSVYGNSNSSISREQMRSNFKQFEKQIEKGWANPK